MKIEKRSENNKLTFKDLKAGDVFKSVAEMIYMKTEEIRKDNEDCTIDDVNALMLSTGEYSWFDEDSTVEPIPNATLIY